jgi:hypothetical protein
MRVSFLGLGVYVFVDAAPEIFGDFVIIIVTASGGIGLDWSQVWPCNE